MDFESLAEQLDFLFSVFGNDSAAFAAVARRMRSKTVLSALFTCILASIWQPGAAVLCVQCSAGTNGRCQSADSACWSYSPAASTTCPAGTQACVCPTCLGDIVGPCHYADGTCSNYRAGTTLCPEPGWECFKGNGYAPSDTPTVSYTPTPSITASPSVKPCVRCAVPTSGQCQDEQSSCWGFTNNATQTCPTGKSNLIYFTI